MTTFDYLQRWYARPDLAWLACCLPVLEEGATTWKALLTDYRLLFREAADILQSRTYTRLGELNLLGVRVCLSGPPRRGWYIDCPRKTVLESLDLWMRERVRISVCHVKDYQSLRFALPERSNSQ